MDNLIELTPQQIAQLQSWLAEFDLDDGLKLLSVTHLPDLDLLIIADSTQGIVTPKDQMSLFDQLINETCEEGYCGL